MFKLKEKAANWSLALALAAGLGASVGSVPAIADDDDDGLIEEVIVTGSRIKRTNAESSVPMTVLGRPQIEGVGTTNIGEFLEKLPSNIAASNQSNNTFTSNSFGLTLNSLRALGSTRTLTLINGKRFVSGVTPNVGYGVDNNMIPVPLIERVEVVTGGTSAVYGSDAIAGVINIIMKDDFEGVSFNVRSGVTAESDRETVDVDLTLGTNFDRGNAYVSVGFSDEESVFARDRGLIDLFAYDNDGDGVRDTNGFLGSSGLPDGNFAGFFGTGAAANLGTGVGSEATSDRYNRGGERILFNPLERRFVRAGITYELTDDLTFNVNTGYTETLTFTEFESFFYNIPDEVFLKNNVQVFDIDIASDLIMPDALKTSLLGLGRGTTVQEIANTGPLFVRRMTDIGNRGSDGDRNTMYIDGSVTYDITEDYSAEFYGSWGRTRFDTSTQGLINNERVRNGLDVELAADGTVQCSSAIARAEGCVPINFYLPAGQMTDAMVNYISTTANNIAEAEQTYMGAVFSGETPLELPGGRIGIAAGVEYRKEKGFVTPAGIITQGVTTTIQANPTRGEFDVTDYFFEARFPVLDILSIDAAVRLGDYSTIGNTTTWKVGFEAPVLDWLKFRGSVSESVRAPNIAELFNGGGETFAQVNDLCDEVTATSVGVADDNCRSIPEIASRIATGVGNDNGEVGVFRLSQTELQGTGGVVGGNPNVGEETADSFTIGAVIDVPMVEGLTVTVDYYDIEVEGAIAATSRSEVLRRCYLATAGFDPTCGGLVTRNQLGATTAVDSSQSNENDLAVAGIDIDVNYTTEVSEWNDNFRGSFTSNLLYNFQEENEQTGIVSGLTDDFVGEVIYPEHRWTASSTYTIDDLAITWRARFWDEVGDNNEASDGGLLVGSPLNDLDSIFYHDIQAAYDINDNINVYFGINNVFDEDPEELGQATNYGETGINTAPEVYDVLGRRYYAGISVDF